ncbi:MAG: hypothetical protein RMJ36_06375 [Candidatus Calescibacterium sp.]|nr:hypothetical protein [Candidatus Calescibacterium sp.]MDW8133261.1 hypothetical protein [Candidatus Calescibacterium sp.]
MRVEGLNFYASKLNSKKMPDYPQKGENVDSWGNHSKKDYSSPDYSDYVDEYEGGGGGNYYEYSGPDGTYSYDPYH